MVHPTSNTEELDKIFSYKHKAQGKLGITIELINICKNINLHIKYTYIYLKKKQP